MGDCSQIVHPDPNLGGGLAWLGTLPGSPRGGVLHGGVLGFQLC